jgi:hypothetical protein
MDQNFLTILIKRSDFQIGLAESGGLNRIRLLFRRGYHQPAMVNCAFDSRRPNCIFRSIPAADSARSRPLIPKQIVAANCDQSILVIFRIQNPLFRGNIVSGIFRLNVCKSFGRVCYKPAWTALFCIIFVPFSTTCMRNLLISCTACTGCVGLK